MNEKCSISCHRMAFTSAEKLKYDKLKEKIFNCLIRIEELEEGYRFVLKNETAIMGNLAEWIPLEHKCCPFLKFNLTVYADDNITLKLEGPPEIKEFLLHELNLS